MKKPAVLVSSIPKAGTHLVGRCLELLGFEDLEIAINKKAYADHNQKGDLDNWDVLQGTEDYLNPKVIMSPCSEVIPTIAAGSFALGHLPRTPGIQACIEKCSRKQNLRHLFVYRDPRAVAVSWYRHCTYHPEKNAPMLYYYVYNALASDEERLMMSIRGVEARAFLPNLYERHFESRIEWLDHEGTLAIRFEDLIGASGGESRERQILTIQRIREWIGQSKGDDEEVAEKLFGNSKTFAAGKSASWVSEFTPAHKEAMLDVAGDLLVDLGYEEGRDW